jgi:hypothetical protein
MNFSSDNDCLYLEIVGRMRMPDNVLSAPIHGLNVMSNCDAILNLLSKWRHKLTFQ